MFSFYQRNITSIQKFPALIKGKFIQKVPTPIKEKLIVLGKVPLSVPGRFWVESNLGLNFVRNEFPTSHQQTKMAGSDRATCLLILKSPLFFYI